MVTKGTTAMMKGRSMANTSMGFPSPVGSAARWVGAASCARRSKLAQPLMRRVELLMSGDFGRSLGCLAQTVSLSVLGSPRLPGSQADCSGSRPSCFPASLADSAARWLGMVCWVITPIVLVWTTGCTPPSTEAPAEVTAENWSVTAWGKRFEVFPEVEPLVAGQTATAHTHVTVLDDFSPLEKGTVELVLSGPAGEQTFGSDSPARPGIFNLSIEPEAPGDYELFFRIGDADGIEEIRSGKVRVGDPASPGGLRVAPAPKGATDGGQAQPFLKEEQWRSDLATEWVRPGKLAGSVTGSARVRPAAGGDAWISSPLDGVLRASSGPWPFPGMRVERLSTVLRVTPLVAADRSLSTLDSDVLALRARLESAQARLDRLEELLELEAVSRRDVEEAQVEVEVLGTQHRAATRDFESAQSSRPGGSGSSLELKAPFAGEVARVEAMPGATVAAGDPLVRLVRTDVLWLEVALAPGDARRLAELGVRGLVLTDPERGPKRLEDGLRLVSVAPEMSPETGTVSVLLEAPPASGLVLGTTVHAQVLLDEEKPGIVIPASAVVDDSGVSVVYLQLSGESFVRQEVRVLERQGDRLLVEGLVPGQRLVSRGGASIRRSSLMSSGQAHGHVH